ncbi:hypothetical protein [Hyphomicrobium sp. MC1]|uniref:hypothetical protein n=1 Tax=Hyphomicrobium sp. (strain MC1) TaxID=717785 RepID=UPI000213E1B8|nr:hypothetical protein [Hyphomicrobium sp. MC1]CCB65240.1 protein of unknown function [Hyphomicrobium sp. MC1]
MGAFILPDGQMTEFADEDFEIAAVEMGARPHLIKTIAREIRLELNKHGGINCDEKTGDQIFLAVARRYGLCDDSDLPPEDRTN